MLKMAHKHAAKPKAGQIIYGKHGDYKLCKELGKGGNGIVYSVRVVCRKDDVLVSDSYAIKIFHPISELKKSEKKKRLKRFRTEVKAVNYLTTRGVKGILPIYDSSVENNGDFQWYLIPLASSYPYRMQQSLHEKLKQMRRLGVIIKNIHAFGMSHRDIKPDNLLWMDNKVILCDFGLAWHEDFSHVTDTGEHIGPHRIVPPELQGVLKDANIDYQKSDVYLFAKTVWIIITGRSTGFEGEYKRDDRMKYLNRDDYHVITFEPLHCMMELATKHYYYDRIGIDDCIQYIDTQLSVLDSEISEAELYSLQYDERMKETMNTVQENLRVYEDYEKIYSILKPLCNCTEIVADEYGREFPLGQLVDVHRADDRLYELIVRGNAFDNYRPRHLYLSIKRASIDNNMSCRLEAVYNREAFLRADEYTRLSEAVLSTSEHVFLNGKYTIHLKKMAADESQLHSPTDWI